MPLFSVNGVDLNVEIDGKGPPLVLLHGLGSSLRTWDEEVRRFSPFFTTVAIDARGHGASTRPAQYTLQDHVDDVTGLMNTLGLDEINLAGSSMGSYVAQGVAAAMPERVHSLILVVPKSHGTTSSSSRILAEHAQQLSGMTHDERQQYLLRLAFGPYASEEVKRAWIQEEQRVPLSEAEWASATAALTGFDFRPALARVTANTLVISGKYDILNTVQDGRECAERIPYATFVEMKRSGHFPNVEEPDLYFTVLSECLANW